MNRIYFIGTFAGIMVLASCNNHKSYDSSSNLHFDTVSSMQMVDTVMNKPATPKVKNAINENTASNTGSADSFKADKNNEKQRKSQDHN